MQKNAVSALIETHVLLMMLKPDSGEGRLGHKRPETSLSPKFDPNCGALTAAVEAQRPMSAVTSEPNSPPSSIVAACVELGEEQLTSHELIDRLVKCLLPVLAREAPGSAVASTFNVLPPVLSAQSPLHADLQDRVKRQREVNRRLRRLLERVVV
ncbi:hypothetical protein [Lysobacter sp. CA199]|uniref:hypothetical protein n=1 Tax=Lysobacter sp. CA199 TaxID=3455608 RepID=UPI003F8D571C